MIELPKRKEKKRENEKKKVIKMNEKFPTCVDVGVELKSTGRME
jgi:hypothetical protein